MLSTEEWVKWIDERSERILSRPEMWGGREALELQLLQLAEIRKLAVDPEALAKDPRLLVDRWGKFCRKHKCGSSSLHRLACSEEEYIQLLRELVSDLKNA